MTLAIPLTDRRAMANTEGFSRGKRKKTHPPHKIHTLDTIHYIIGGKCQRVKHYFVKAQASNGHLTHKTVLQISKVPSHQGLKM